MLDSKKNNQLSKNNHHQKIQRLISHLFFNDLWNLVLLPGVVLVYSVNPHLYSILVLLLKVASSPHEDSHLHICYWLYDIIQSELLDSYQMLKVNIFKDGFDRTIFNHG